MELGLSEDLYFLNRNQLIFQGLQIKGGLCLSLLPVYFLEFHYS